MELEKVTLSLKQYLNQLMQKYEENNPPEHMSDKAFFLRMKKETAPIYDLLEEWEVQALDQIKNRKMNVHPHQIVSTKENIELIILHSYYIDARRKRYMELNHSSHYIFDQLLRDIQSIEKRKGEVQ